MTLKKKKKGWLRTMENDLISSTFRQQRARSQLQQYSVSAHVRCNRLRVVQSGTCQSYRQVPLGATLDPEARSHWGRRSAQIQRF